MKPEPLAANAFLQGKAPSSWEQDKVYIIDCWATWCVPCKTTIPRLNRLYTDYQAKGLRVIGVSVFGEERTNVEAFLKAEGSGMSYPVAIAEKGGAFESQWLKAADVSSLPSAFVVKNGKLLFVIHSGKITNETVEALLAGGEREAAVAKKSQPEITDEERSANEAAERMKRVSLLLRDCPNDPSGTVAYMDRILADNPKLPAEDKQMLMLIKVSRLDRKKLAEALRIVDEAKALAPNSKTARDLENVKQALKAGAAESK